MAENGAKWRFFEGQKRHFVVLRADCARLQHARLPGLTFMECGWLAKRLERQIGSEAPFFVVRGTKQHTQYGVDLTIAPILLRDWGVPRDLNSVSSLAVSRNRPDTAGLARRVGMALYPLPSDRSDRTDRSDRWHSASGGRRPARAALLSCARAPVSHL